MLEFRRMGEQDLDEVMRIENDSFSVPWTRIDFEESLKKPSAIYLVAVSEGKVVGYSGLWGVLDEGQINNVAVAREYRGQKIGIRLLEEMCQLGKREGLTSFTLEVRASNVPAIALYEKAGFRNEGIRKNYYSSPKEDAIIMWRYE